MQEIYRALARLMSTDLTVMVTGESGAGKELVARALHDYGKRRKGPFVALNMAAIPRELIESELFGHERGAFTGAVQRSAGKFEQASGGTLFLDEIGDMPPEAQTRLLRVLQEGEYTTVGGRTPIKANVRIVAATHRDLRRQIQQGLFREDLFYRLNVVPIRLPPLRERLDDIPELANHYLQAATRRRPADQGPVARGDGAAEAASLAGQRARAGQPGAPPVGALLEESHRRRDDREPSWRMRCRRSITGPRRRRCREDISLADAVDRHLQSLFAAHGDRLPPDGMYDRVISEVERPLLVPGAWGNARESVARGPPLGAQSQYVAQEDQGPRRPRGSHAAGSPRRVTSVTAALGVSRLGDKMSSGGFAA